MISGIIMIVLICGWMLGLLIFPTVESLEKMRTRPRLPSLHSHEDS
jgi:hypothetical protein